jgi:hypothetical protein
VDFPQSVTVSPRSTTVDFTVTAPNNIKSDVTGPVTATYNGSSQSVAFSLKAQ